MPTKKNSLFVCLFFMLCLCGMVLLVAVNPTGGADVGWHLKIGEVAWNQGSTLPKDDFSATAKGTPWVYKDLYADQILYVGFSYLGFYWFVILKSFLLLLMAYAFGRLFSLRRFGWSWLLLVGLLYGAVAYRFIERPLIFSLALFMLQLSLLEKLRLSPQIESYREILVKLLPIVLVQWLWVSLHRGAMLGYVLIFGWFAGLAIAYWVRDSARLRRWFGQAPSLRFLLGAGTASVLSVLLGFINPSGLATFSTSLNVMGSKAIQQNISEWKAVSLGVFVRFFPFAAVLVAVTLLGLGIFLVFRLREEKATASESEQDQISPLTLWPLLAFVMFLVLSTRSIRWIPYLSMFSVILLGHLWGEMILPRGMWPRLSRSWAISFSVVALVLVTLHQRRLSPLEVGFNKARLPVKAVEFIQKHRLKGNALHAFRFGGYMIWKLWPQTRVFIDGRNDMVYSEEKFMSAIQSQWNPYIFDRYQLKYKVQWVLVNNQSDQQTHPFLAKDPKWAMVFWSETAVIFVRRDSYPYLKSLFFRYLRYPSIDSSVFYFFQKRDKTKEMIAGLYDELKRIVRRSPQGLRANIAMTLFLYLRGQSERPRFLQWKKRLLRIGGHRPEVKEFFRRLQRL